MTVVAPVRLSNRRHLTTYPSGSLATAVSAAAFLMVSGPGGAQLHVEDRVHRRQVPSYDRVAAINEELGATDRRAEVEQVVPDNAAAAVGDHRIERVDGLRVDVVHPRGERAVRPQLPAMLVRDDVVGIVGAGPVETESTDRPARKCFAGDDAVRPVGIAMGLAEQRPDVRLLERATLSRPLLMYVNFETARPGVFAAENRSSMDG